MGRFNNTHLSFENHKRGRVNYPDELWDNTDFIGHPIFAFIRHHIWKKRLSSETTLEMGGLLARVPSV